MSKKSQSNEKNHKCVNQYCFMLLEKYVEVIQVSIVNIIDHMSRSLKLVIRNAKRSQFSQSQTRGHSLTPLSKNYSAPIDLNEKLNHLQGNLRMLQKRYRQNLKEGFDHKIKAYRLQAVVQRKMLKQAIQQTQRANEREQIKEKIETNSRQKRLEQSRALMAQLQKEQRIKFIKQRNFRQKRGLSITLHQRKASLEHQIRTVHDKITEQQANINKKRDYFDFIKRATLKKQQLQTKKEILTKIISNTDRLKDLKSTLQDLREVHHRQEIFLTI